MRIAFALAALLAMAGCTTTQPDTSPLTQCPEPRPQVCTMEYAPACGTLSSGGNKEYASGCNACADDAVVGYMPGPCAE
jgi:hypothetical protein